MNEAAEFLSKFPRYIPTESDNAVLKDLKSFSLKIDRENRTVFCDCVFCQPAKQKKLYEMEQGIKAAYCLSEFRFFPVFTDCSVNEKYVCELVDLLELYYGEGYARGFLDEYSAEFDGKTLKIALRDGLASAFLIENKIDSFFEDAVKARFGKNIKVTFIGEARLDHVSEAVEKLQAESLRSYEKSLESKARQTSKEAAEGCDNRSYDPVEGDAFEIIASGNTIRSGRLAFDISQKELVFGYESEAALVPIRNIKLSKRLSFLCRVFQAEEKESRDGLKVNYTLGVTDLDASITVRFSTEKDCGFILPAARDALLVCGTASTDAFDGEVKVRAVAIYKVNEILKTDDAAETRVELHLHTTLSANDALCAPEDVIPTAERWGMPAIAVTDHGNVQAFPEIMLTADKHPSVKPLYGMEGYLVDDTARAVFDYSPEHDRSFSEGIFTIFDIETTGLSPLSCGITEIGAIRYRGGEVIDVFETFVNPGMPIPPNITALTGITDDMVKDAPSQKEAVVAFLNFAGDTMLVAHNANFDMGFIRKAASDNRLRFNNPYLDTVSLSRYLNPGLAKHNLEAVRKHYGLGEFKHHRASDDSEMLSKIFGCMIRQMEPDGVTTVGEMMNEMSVKTDPRKLKPYHVTILVKNNTGMKNLYKLISYSYLNYFYRFPRIPKTILNRHREGLIIGSACESGEIYQSVLENRTYADQMKAADFYDYFEIMPKCNNGFLIDEGKLSGVTELERINRRILEIADKQKKLCVATGDVHFMTKDDEIYRQILKYGQKYSDAFRKTEMYLKTTAEMLDEFSYLGDRAYEVVVTNTRKIAEMVDSGIRPIPKGKYTPIIEGAEDELVNCCREKAHLLYGEKLPEIVELRMNRELDAIIKHGFAVLYIIARKLVLNSESKGYLVGSRGSVGSSLIANLADISEVNPLPPHYRCPKCRHSEFFADGSVGSGFDMPDKSCPVCGNAMICDGHDIPFETFLGFKGDKDPDIDLNFSGNVQSDAHKYTEVLFGKENIFRAGTVGTIASKTAYGYVRKYLDDKQIPLSKAEINRLTNGCVGVKRTTGQHPGGIIVIPKQYDVYDFTPVQHPADKESSDVITTHFAFEYLHETILKLDMLGHDVPTMYKVIGDYTGIDVRTVPMNDKKVMSLFTSPAALGLTSEDIDCETGTLALPEMGTPYVRGMMVAAKPRCFSDLLQISGLSHGTGIWLGNGEELIKSGICTIDTIIGTRDSIMLYLLQKGLDTSSAFKIMESVRKGFGVSESFEAEMLAHDVPDWYIASCRKIKYMFPKAHAAAYVISALRLAWFKVYYPVEFYATYFTARPDGIDYSLVMKSKGEIKKYMEDLKKQETTTQKDDDVYTCLQVVSEMYARGITFLTIDLFKSRATEFI
ncbi:MAG: PolC-type DNA polymerase III, partial [Eubacteriales bacterium]|nr:PolC-type DNA polymerase III [Eubacteriales bacterium]